MSSVCVNTSGCYKKKQIRRLRYADCNESLSDYVFKLYWWGDFCSNWFDSDSEFHVKFYSEGYQ